MDAARWATFALWEDPERCSPEGKALLNAKVQVVGHLRNASTHDGLSSEWWAKAKGDGSPEHREVVRILIHACGRRPNLTTRTARPWTSLRPGVTGRRGSTQRSQRVGLLQPSRARSICSGSLAIRDFNQ
jgi:hypothetical protein